MKSKMKLFGIIAMVAVIVFSMTACGDNGETDISDVDARFLGTWVGGLPPGLPRGETITISEDQFHVVDNNATDFHFTFTITNWAQGQWTYGEGDDAFTFTVRLTGSITAVGDTLEGATPPNNFYGPAHRNLTRIYLGMTEEEEQMRRTLFSVPHLPSGIRYDRIQ